MHVQNKALFIDRDGVINNNSKYYYIYNSENFEFNDGIIDIMKYAQKKNYLLIIISNQGGIAKGIYTKTDVEKLHTYMQNTLRFENIIIDEIYYCPHHSEIESCLCRKPDTLLLEKAIARFGIDVSKSYFLGDSPRDIEAARKVGIIPIFVNSNIINANEVIERIK